MSHHCVELSMKTRNITPQRRKHKSYNSSPQTCFKAFHNKSTRVTIRKLASSCSSHIFFHFNSFYIHLDISSGQLYPLPHLHYSQYVNNERSTQNLLEYKVYEITYLIKNNKSFQ